MPNLQVTPAGVEDFRLLLQSGQHSLVLTHPLRHLPCLVWNEVAVDTVHILGVGRCPHHHSVLPQIPGPLLGPFSLLPGLDLCFRSINPLLLLNLKVFQLGCELLQRFSIV